MFFVSFHVIILLNNYVYLHVRQWEVGSIRNIRCGCITLHFGIANVTSYTGASRAMAYSSTSGEQATRLRFTNWDTFFVHTFSVIITLLIGSAANRDAGVASSGKTAIYITNTSTACVYYFTI